MNRPIKFRAWSRKENRFVYGTLTGTDIECSFNPKGVDGKEPQDTYLEELELEWWEQFTGLLDKNGKEIYEGDWVVLVIAGTVYQGWVEWEKDSSDYSIVNTNGYQSAFGITDAKYEIIGNLYENPELLS